MQIFRGVAVSAFGALCFYIAVHKDVAAERDRLKRQVDSSIVIPVTEDGGMDVLWRDMDYYERRDVVEELRLEETANQRLIEWQSQRLNPQQDRPVDSESGPQ